MSSPKSITVISEEIRERERLARRSEQARQRRQKLAMEETPEQRRQRIDKKLAAKRRKQSKESPEQRRQRLDKEATVKRKRRSEETPEQLYKRRERDKERKRIREKERQEKETPDETPEQLYKRRERDKERKRIREKERREKETPEETQQRLAKKAEQERIRRGVRRKDPQRVKEQREKNRFYNLTRSINITEEEREKKRITHYFWYQANKERFKSEEVKKRRTENYKLWVKGLTGEKKERYLESVRKALKKSQKKIYERDKQDPERWEAKLRYFRERHAKRLQIPERREEWNRKQRERYARETPEETLRRRRKDKVNNAKRKMRMRLNADNVSPEEIEFQLKQLGETMWRDFYPEGDVPIPGSRGWKRTNKPVTNSAVPVLVARETPSSATKGTSILQKPRVSANLQMDSCIEKSGVNLDSSLPESPFYEDFESQSPEPSSPTVMIAAENSQDDCMWQKMDVQNVPQLDSSFLTSEHPIPGSTITENTVTPSPVPSPPSSPPVYIQNDEKTTNPIIFTFDLQKLPCLHCDVTFSSDHQLRSHLFTCHSKKCWKCPKCKQVMLSPQELSQHYASTHTNKPPQNPPNTVPTFTRTSCQGNYLCLKCPPRNWFATRQDLFAHVKQQHSSNFWPCLKCQVLKYSEHAIRLHQTVCHFV